MRFIRESRRGGFINFVYEMNEFDFVDAVYWVSNVVGKEIIVTNVITLRDSKRNYDEGNQSVQLECPLDEKQILEKIRAKEIDKISFSGKYKSDSISVCYNLQKNIIALSFDERNNVDRATMESELGLV